LLPALEVVLAHRLEDVEHERALGCGGRRAFLGRATGTPILDL
jgi:hypothetical protein